MRALRALLISDGRPGHFRLADGILAAISRERGVEIKRIVVRRRPFVPARVVSSLVNGGMSPTRVFKLVYGIEAGDLPACDVVVSAGGNTLGANIASSRLMGIPNIFYGSLRRFRADDFSLVMTSYASQAVAPNQLMTLKPSAFDPDALGDLKSKSSMEVSDTVGLILGGNAGTVRFKKLDWDRLFAFVSQLHKRFGVRWVVSNSARTPDVVSERFRRALQDGNGRAISSFIDVREPKAASLNALFEQCRVIACTADSSSMVSECVWARRKVLAVTPERFSLPGNERAYRDWLADQGWVVELPISSLNPGAFSDVINRIHPLEANPLDRLSREIRARVPALFS